MQMARRLYSTATMRLALALIIGVFAFGIDRAGAAVIATIDFENEPALPPQPNNFAAAGPMQTYSKAGVYTISGGVVLGTPTFLPAFLSRGTPPNAYGTSDLGDVSLQPAISLTLPAGENVVEVTGVLFNGQPISEVYNLTAFRA